MNNARYYGHLKKWLDGRDCGFIRPEDGANDVFVPGREFDKAKIDPRTGMMLSYRIENDYRNRPFAVALRVEREDEPVRQR